MSQPVQYSKRLFYTTEAFGGRERMRPKTGHIFVLGIAGLLGGCQYDVNPVTIQINSSFSPQTIPAKSNVVIVLPGVSSGQAMAKDVTGKLMVGDRVFDMTGNGYETVSYSTNDHCKVFPTGVQIFKYQLFKGATMIKEDSLQVTVEC
ncbi:hypothetical protein [Deinococcus sp.]|uniref:hypothetical protein n=1 Tax=Deinococcus sp. TaxID=47478 RepID=UPI003CC673A8